MRSRGTEPHERALIRVETRNMPVRRAWLCWSDSWTRPRACFRAGDFGKLEGAQTHRRQLEPGETGGGGVGGGRQVRGRQDL